ncbi:PaaI family thioesterase [bacterium]|nr:PaaI family thioesterase [bacterium]
MNAMMDAPPHVEVPASWKPVKPFEGMDSSSQFIPHAATDDRLMLRYYQDDADGSFKTWAWFGRGAEGAPGRVHGGSVSAILDEVLGACVWMGGMPVVTATLTIRYRNPLPLGTVCDIETRIERRTSKRAIVKGVLKVRGGSVIAEAEGVYFRLPDSEIPPAAGAVLARRRGEGR